MSYYCYNICVEAHVGPSLNVTFASCPLFVHLSVMSSENKENKRRKTREEKEEEKALQAVAKQMAEELAKEKATQSTVPSSSAKVFIVITFPFPSYHHLASSPYLHAG